MGDEFVRKSMTLNDLERSKRSTVGERRLMLVLQTDLLVFAHFARTVGSG